VGDITDLEGWSAPVASVGAGCVGLGLIDHGWVEVDSCHVEAVPACQLDRQVTRPASYLEDPSLLWGSFGDVVCYVLVKRTEQAPTKDAVGAGIPDQDPARRPVSPSGAEAVSRDSDGRGHSEQDQPRP
jgi:hypothetical protein